jgi:PmbA protein
MTALLDQSDLLDRAARLVEAARRAGADAADAISVRGVSMSVDVRLGKVEETNRAEGDDFSLRVFVGRRNASVSANVFTDPAALAERAVAMARVAPEDKFAGLADPGRLAKELPDLDLLDETIPSSESLTDAARGAEEAALAVRGVTNSGGGSAGWSLAGLVLATSHGFSGSYLTSRFGLSAMAIAGEGTGMERDHESVTKTHFADLRSPEWVGGEAGRRAVARLNPGKLPTGRGTVVFDPRISAGLVGHLAGAANGAAIARKTSFLMKALGTAILPPGVRVADDPFRLRGLGSRPFDGEGVRAEPFALIEDGVLTRWFLDSATARELGLETNGRAARGGGNPSPGSTNLTLEPGDVTPEALIVEAGDGIYVTDLIGQGVNIVTGDYSRGAAGFRIAGGKLAEPVSEITIAGNLRDMYPRLRVANDLQYRYATNAPTLAIEGMTIAGR